MSQIILKRLNLICKFEKTFKEDIEPYLPPRINRGALQGVLLKKYNLPRSGPNMRLINEMMHKFGYKKIIINGECLYRKFNANEIKNEPKPN